MMSAQQLTDLEYALRLALQKVGSVNLARHYGDTTSAEDVAKIEREEGHLFGAAGELKDLIGKLPEPAAIGQPLAVVVECHDELSTALDKALDALSGIGRRASEEPA